MVSSKTGFLFPGQGAQFVGMGKEWFDQFDTARSLFEKADRVLGVPLSRICFEGPEEALTQTLNAQPAIFVTSLAIDSVLKEIVPDLRPSLVAGLSLGEFSALAAAGSLDFIEGVKLVRRRAELMEKAAQESRGGMVSVIGLSQGDCAAIAKDTGIEMANLNAPDQFVLSGAWEGVEKAAALADQKGAKRAVLLKVSGAFHSKLMGKARSGLQEALKGTILNQPCCSFVPNVLAAAEEDPYKIKEYLGEQVTSPVRWVETMQYAKRQGITKFIELGPGKVLKGLARRIDPALEVVSVEKIKDLGGLKVQC